MKPKKIDPPELKQKISDTWRELINDLGHQNVDVDILQELTEDLRNKTEVLETFRKYLPCSPLAPTNNFWHRYFTPQKELNKRYRLSHQPLWSWIIRNEPSKTLEIGFGKGFNLLMFLKLNPDCDYFCFDLFDGSFLFWYFEKRLYRKILEKVKAIDSVHLFKGDTRKTLPKWVDKLPSMDLILIDGGHSYEVCKNDWICSKRLMSSKTTVWFHDYSYSQEVDRVVDEIDEDVFSKKVIRPKIGPYFVKVEKK
ncbi:hypothetical protein AKJ45_00260 [candidate division MSBL1 archaeon SCGC-AAA261F19]|uniref:Methyltransferase n=1 Tax=candidate division MSBL1 archaeon SCGC-AAA261F19 TaxID=1698275 RepID=A0A133VBL8_9EURY|nr:hypothetical protein AKJ45_00260 [candidate division MSBL1 archaeon SCGC-AAA261F19]